MVSPSHSDNTGTSVSSEKSELPQSANGGLSQSSFVSSGVLPQPWDSSGDGMDAVRTANVENGIPWKERGFIERMKISFRLRNRDSPCFNTAMMRDIPSLSEFQQSYSLIAALLDIEPSFLMARRFGWLRIRVLLRIQDELRELEHDYQELERDGEKEPRFNISRHYDEDHGGERGALLDTINEKLKEYDDVLFRVKQIYALAPPTKRDVNSLYRFIEDTGAIQHTEREWISHVKDLAALGPDYGDDWFRQLVEKCLKLFSRRLTLKFFRTKTQAEQTGKYTALHLVSKSRIEAIVYVVVSAGSTAFLLVPVGILSWMQDSGTNTNIISEVLVIFGFTLFFTLCCSAITRASREHLFIASATYIAVLVVFLGTRLQSQSSGAVK